MRYVLALLLLASTGLAGAVEHACDPDEEEQLGVLTVVSVPDVSPPTPPRISEAKAKHLLALGTDEALDQLARAAEIQYYDLDRSARAVSFVGERWMGRIAAQLPAILLRRDPSESLPEHAMSFIAARCEPGIEPLLLRQLEPNRNRFGEGARLAAIAIGRCKTPHALETLTRLVSTDERPIVRCGAIWGLEHLGDRGAIPALRASLRLRDALVRDIRPKDNPQPRVAKFCLHALALEAIDGLEQGTKAR